MDAPEHWLITWAA